jgi:hypothetical protein
MEVPVEAWRQSYDGIEEKQGVAKAVTFDASGNVVVTGTSGGEFFTAKYATNGVLLWEKRGPPGGAQAVAVDNHDNVLVTGFSPDYYTAKYAADDGALLWEQGATNSSVDAKFDYGKESTIAADRDGNVIISGTTDLYSDRDSTSAYVAKYSATDGALLWEHSLGGRMPALAVDTDGNVVISGTVIVGNPRGGLNSPAFIPVTVKYAAADGTALWGDPHPTYSPDQLSSGRLFDTPAVALDASNDVIVSRGTNRSDGHADVWDCYVAKYASSNSSILWGKRIDFGSSRFLNPAIAAVDSNGDVWVGHNGYTVKFAGVNGAVLWDQNHPVFVPIAVDENDNVIVTGVEVTDAVNVQTFAFKYPATGGTSLWELNCGSVRSSQLPDFLFVRERNLAVGPNGSIAVILNTENDFTIVTYTMTQFPYPTPVVLSLALTPEGARLRFAGDAGRTYRLPRASDPSGPWSTFAALTAPPDGAIEHLDTAPPCCFQSYFYRTAAP